MRINNNWGARKFGEILTLGIENHCQTIKDLFRGSILYSALAAKMVRRMIFFTINQA
jgi:hypothetical protein